MPLPRRYGFVYSPVLTDRGHQWVAGAVQYSSRGFQDAVDRGRADLRELRFYGGIQIEMSVPLHRVDQERKQRLQPLGANAVARFPEHYERFAYSFVVQAITYGLRFFHTGPQT